MTGAQNRLIHELVEQSRDRVAHVRAGQSLLDVLDTQYDPTVSRLPPPVASALVRQKAPGPNSPTKALLHQATASDASGLRAVMRKRAAVALAPLHADFHRPSAGSAVAPALAPSSYEQYAFYAGSKVTQSESLHMLTRRKAVATSSSSKQLAKLVQAHEAATQPPASTTTNGASLTQAVAALKGRNAFLQLKTKAAVSKLRTRPLARLPTDYKNTHLAFLEFKAANDPLASRGRAVSELARLNATTRTPLRFGDAVCFLSRVADVPLAIGRNGRSLRVDNAVAGPHMVFTLVDFCDPTRRDDVLVGDDVWLRVDASQLDVGDDDEIVALLVDTHYYLGGPGSLEEDEDDGHGHRDERESPAGRHSGAARKYEARTGTRTGPRRSDERAFKLVAMKASVPSNEFYGDDAATREVAMETNATILRLAKWRFTATATTPSRRHSPGRPSRQTPTRGGRDDDRATNDNDDKNDQLVLNCATVGLRLGEFALDFDAARHRGVLRGSLTRAELSDGHRASDHVERRESCTWQVRLMRRDEPSPRQEDDETTTRRKEKPPPPPSSPTGKRRAPTEQQSLEWLQFHHDKVARDAKHVAQKRALAREAHAAYDSVAVRSNAKLLQIEKTKAVHPRAYFLSRFQHVVDQGTTTTDHKRNYTKHTATTTTLPRL